MYMAPTLYHHYARYTADDKVRQVFFQISLDCNDSVKPFLAANRIHVISRHFEC